MRRLSLFPENTEWAGNIDMSVINLVKNQLHKIRMLDILKKFSTQPYGIHIQAFKLLFEHFKLFIYLCTEHKKN